MTPFFSAGLRLSFLCFFVTVPISSHCTHSGGGGGGAGFFFFFFSFQSLPHFLISHSLFYTITSATRLGNKTKTGSLGGRWWWIGVSGLDWTGQDLGWVEFAAGLDIYGSALAFSPVGGLVGGWVACAWLIEWIDPMDGWMDGVVAASRGLEFRGVVRCSEIRCASWWVGGDTSGDDN
jgi:hypothetical protein